MPYINIKTSFKLKEENVLEIKTGLAKVMNDVAGKPENWLMIGFSEEKLFFKGQQCDKAALVELKLVGKLDSQKKEILSREFCNILKEKADIPQDYVYIIINEVEGSNWGWNCTTF